MFNMTKEGFITFRKEFDEAMQGLRNKYDVDIRLGNIGYDVSGTNFHAKVSVTNKEVNGMPSKQVEFEKWAKMIGGFYGIKPEHYGANIKTYVGDEFTVVGVKPSARKNCMLIKKISDGKTYVASPDVVGNYLKAQG